MGNVCPCVKHNALLSVFPVISANHRGKYKVDAKWNTKRLAF